MTPEALPKRKPVQLIAAGLFAFAAVAVIAGFYGGRYIDRTRVQSPQEKLQEALQAFRSGYDQTALSVFKPLADEGNPKAQYWLADMYENGTGVKPDPSAARDLLEKSAAQGFLPAEERLGNLYLRGTQTLQDFGKAQNWLHSAAIAGDGAAQRELGQIFALGLGVPRDLPEAYGWYENAVLSGDGLAPHLRDDLLTRMSPAEIEKGEQIAKDIEASIKPSKP